MRDDILAELNRRFPFTAGLQGEALVEAIAANWDSIDAGDLAHMFKRMAMFVASTEVSEPGTLSSASLPALPASRGADAIGIAGRE